MWVDLEHLILFKANISILSFFMEKKIKKSNSHPMLSVNHDGRRKCVNRMS
jgi:hypothetical protein